ncbi:acyl-CoA dehydrogenase family protein [Aromatoleum anaerobium]|uniref:Acyl-CoA dehydrogenase n=1 Tax=Aromatoleum anaerobium TaxID=182180 RepID=A0ABX1PML1_9RHOO|nr:acyl-CoA dehydrogenase family protein [Aromatoleum anaerobium]MCK0508120.1 acyl-CoA/acyl-ACP dehydrogenase [Aromatoleum anaerobium]
MDLQFTDEQNMLRDMTRNLCADYSGADVVRKMENDPLGVPAELWQQMRQTGLLGMGIPEEHGGMGLNMLDCAVIYEELGRSLAPGPYFASTVMSASAIRHAGDASARAGLLAAIGSGDAIVAPAWLEPDCGFGPAGVQLRAARDGDAYVLDGIKRHVFHAAAAQQLLVLARSGGPNEGGGAVDLFLVDTDAPGVRLEQQRSMASDTQYKVSFDGVRVPAANRVGAAGSGWKAWEAAMYDGLILLAAFAAGGAERALEITVQYSKDREQFGKPIGAFQALAHYMSDASAVVDGARMLVQEAAWAHANGKDVTRLAPMAKLFACKAFRDVTHMAQQVHGGIGFTLDYDIQLFYRRAKQLQMNWWDSRYLEGLIAADILDRDAPRTIPDPFTA